jgi:serralysin
MKKIKKSIERIVAAVMLGAILLTSVPLGVKTADAKVADWIQGASIHPYTTTHFGTDEMKASLRQLKATGANYAVLIIPYYQANRESSEMRPGWNTPTDEALISAITYAKSLGMKVMLKPHLETDYIEWRGNINAWDREAWFASYTAMLTHYGRIAEQYGVEDYCIGTELIRMANPNYNSTNTQNWKEMIADVREVYSGKLTYSSNWDGELEFIGFWNDLDYIGISAYYDLYHAQNSSPEELRKSWDGWRSGLV